MSGASRTAAYMALFRALETRRRAGLFKDPYAERFLPGRLRAAARLPGAARFIDSRWPGARTSAVARTRAIDDLVTDAVTAGARQVVLLGAGYDTRALRMPELAEVEVFELDRPALLAAKGEALEADGVHRVAIDFAEQKPLTTLTRDGFDPGAKAAFIWEGVTNYLSAEAVDATLREVARAAEGSRLIFTYVHGGVIDGSVRFEGDETLRAKVADVGEPWTFGLDPGELPGYLSERGLRLLSDEGADDYRRRLLGDSPRLLRGYGFYRLALAEVG
jgi:methyltransferase (TIGR00027 family)